MDYLSSEDSFITQLNYETMHFLTFCLNESGGWRVLAERCVFGSPTQHSFSQNFMTQSNAQLYVFGKSTSPASSLLHELGNRLCTVQCLSQLLKDCNLHMARYALCGPESLEIIQHPTSVESGIESSNTMFIQYGETLRLECKASGLPPPTYSWFRDNEELEDQKEEVLLIKEFGSVSYYEKTFAVKLMKVVHSKHFLIRPEHVGEYCCRVAQILPSEGTSVELVSESVEVVLRIELPEIRMQPKPEYCPEGSDLTLSFSIYDSPTVGEVHFQWFKENQLLPGCNTNVLKINNVSVADEGTYKCYITNKAGELWTDEAKITIYHEPEGRAPRAKEKFALLIGNNLYQNHSCLKTPSSDVGILSRILKKLKFKVVALRNLTLIEMRNSLLNFCKMLPEGAYALFYFVGHGFEIQDKFMLPVDAPGSESYLRAHSLCETEVIREVYKTCPGLLVILLDMCLKIPDENENPGIHNEVPNFVGYQPGERNLVKGYATTSNLGAYERVSETNGIYAKHLAQALSSYPDLPIVKVLEKVNEGVAREAPDAAKKQMPFVSHNVVKNYCLSAEVEGDAAACAMYNELIHLPTANGIPIELSFSKKNLTAEALIECHRGTFLNSLDISIRGVESWKVEFEIPSKLIKEEESITGGVKLIIHNLQRHKMKLFLTVQLRDPHDNRMVDHCMIDLSYPLVSKWTLWHERTEN